MRRIFNESIFNFSTEAKELELTTSERQLSSTEQTINRMLNRYSQKEGNNYEDQKRIFEIQREKQNIMKALHEQLKCLDDAACNFEHEKDARLLLYRDGSLTYLTEHGKEDVATLGEVICDMDWGVYYSLDKKTVPRSIAKKYIIERARHKLEYLYDSQIIISETTRRGTNDYVKSAYQNYERERANLLNRTGFLVENITKSLLKRMQYDSDADFQILNGNLYQDVIQKVDFIIRLKVHNRGVKVESDEEPDKGQAKGIGIQFTINREALDKKREQIARTKEYLQKGDVIDDVVLVLFPIHSAQKMKRLWESQGRPAGGPGQFMVRSQVRNFLTNILSDLVTPEQLEKIWNQNKEYYGNEPFQN